MAQEIIGTKDGQNFFVGSNTPAAPAPAPAPAVAPPVRRYTNPTPAPAPITYNGNPILNRPTGPAPVDENQIREQTRQRMQSSIDAINAQYVNLIGQEQVAGKDRAGQTRAMNARSGLMGSDFGQANQVKTQQFNQQQVKFLEDEKTAKVTSIMQNIEDRASQEIQARKQEALGQYERDSEAFQMAQEQARGDLQTLAKSGVDLESLEPAQRAALLKQAGYEDNDMTSLIYNAMKPLPQQIDYKFEKLADGQGLFYGVDPMTGELVTKNVSVDLPPDWQMQIAPDGTVIGFNKNTGETAMLSEQGQFMKPEDIGPGGLTKDQRTELQRIQGNVRQDPDVKDFITLRDGYERVQTGANQNNAQGDLALLFGFMKMLDPNSVVRETEFANAEQAQGTLQRFFNIPSKFIKGTRLTEEGRKYFADAAQELYSRKEQSYQRAVDFYGNQLDQFNIPREMGLRDFGTTLGNESVSLTPLNGNDPRRFTNPLVAKYPYLEVAQFVQEYPDATEDEIRELVGFNGSDTGSSKNVGVKKTGMRTDRHNNPTAFTTDIAKIAGLKEGVDYTVGDPFSNGRYHTANLLKDPIATTIKVIDKIGFYTQSGQLRWTYVNSIPQAKQWNSLTYPQKKQVIAQMYKHEGGSALNKYFA